MTKATIIYGKYKEENKLLSRVPMIPTDLLFTFKRLQPHQWPSGFALKFGRREVPDSIPICGCRSSRSEFTVVFSETRVNADYNDLHGERSPTGPGPTCGNWALILQFNPTQTITISSASCFRDENQKSSRAVIVRCRVKFGKSVLFAWSTLYCLLQSKNKKNCTVTYQIRKTKILFIHLHYTLC